ncbi:MAG: glycosyltransferase [Chloroflexota bacterium]|nr:glycosyltransferase [Chloroflexota bacterium]
MPRTTESLGRASFMQLPQIRCSDIIPGALTFHLLRHEQQPDSAGAASGGREILSPAGRPSGPVTTTGVDLGDDRQANASARDDSGAVDDLEYRFAAAAFAELEAAVAGRLGVLVLEAAPAPLATEIADRGHAVTVLDTVDAVSGHPGGDGLVDGTTGPRRLRVAARCEQLPFVYGSFDVVMWIPGLEGIPPGNDRAVLWDIGRVLRPGGRLILTLRLGARSGSALDAPHGQQTVVKPFPTPETVRRLLGHISQTFVISPGDLPTECDRPALELGQVARPGRGLAEGSVVPSITPRPVLGAVLERRAEAVRPPAAALVTAYLEGQAALEARVIDVAAEIAALRVGKDTTAPVAEERRRALDQEAANAMTARLELLEEQELAAEAYLRACSDDAFWQWVEPRLGVLRQHDPIPFHVPEHYLRTVPLSAPPTIAIVTPTLNGSRFLRFTLDSALDQDYPALEYVVQDGGSTDESLTILEQYKSRLTHVASEKDTGMAQAINRGFAHTSGEIMAYLNADDLLLPGTLNVVAAYFATHPEVDVVYGHRVLIDPHNAEIGRWVLPPHDDAVLSWTDYVPQETLFWRRRAWEKIGGAMDESFRFALDWDLLLRFREGGATFKRLPRFLGAFRVHDDQKTSTQLSGLGSREIQRLREREAGRPISRKEVRQHVELFMRRHKLYHKLYRIGVLRY